MGEYAVGLKRSWKVAMWHAGFTCAVLVTVLCMGAVRKGIAADGAPEPAAPSPVNEALTAYVKEVGARLSGVTGVEGISFTVFEDNTPDAYLLGERGIILTSGLVVRLSNEAELAGMAGHLIGHMEAGHGAGPYTLDQELEAEELAMKYVIANNYDPFLVVRMQERLIEYRERRDKAWSSGYLTHHPASRKRLAVCRNAAAEVGPGGSSGRQRFLKRVGFSLPASH